MGQDPLVSVIIPTYNHAHFLREALKSVCEQTFKNWEAIVVNNYSEDDTISVVESFCDERIRLENFHNNGVIAAARNRGIALARGHYLAFLDSDDIWFPEKLASCIPRLENDGCDLVCHGLHWFGDRREKDVYYGPARRATFDGLLYKGNCIATSATMVRRGIVESVGGFSEEKSFHTAEDYHLWLKLAQAQAVMGFMDRVLGSYRFHNANTGGVIKQAKAVRCVLDDFFSKGRSCSLLDRIRMRFRYGTNEYAVGRGLQARSQFQDAWPYLFRALFLHPLYFRTYVAIGLNLFCFNPDKL
ncbi:MAG: hypothetical protein AUK36_03850 [Zetaproteobacteria bacterium CG2_30_59_37]|nr:MAG: hypothetical protein AUK36_03850 [Zetaproteobacteria bacterium CG2_30_59_37]